MAAVLLLTKAKGYRATLVAFRPESEGGLSVGLAPDTWLPCLPQPVPSRIFQGVLQH